MSKVPIVEIDAVPPLSDRELEAVRVALARLGVDLNPSPPVDASAWRVASAREAVESELSRSSYTRSPRKTRGATRA